VHILANSIITALEPAAPALAVETFQGLLVLDIFFGEVSVDVDHIGSPVQFGPVVDLVALLLGQLMLFVPHQVDKYSFS
jgi:hypothetical protein